MNFSTIANPQTSPSVTIKYTLTVTDASGNVASDAVTVTAFPSPTITISPNQTILQGTYTLLSATGALKYYWEPGGTLTNKNTANPTAEPKVTTVYSVSAVDANGCGAWASDTIFVVPTDTLVFYNTFTPNGDGANDFFYIGNIENFPKNRIEIYNRNGKLVFQASPYLNNWDGKVDGSALPCATYYYVLDPGTEKEKLHGALTIIR